MITSKSTVRNKIRYDKSTLKGHHLILMALRLFLDRCFPARQFPKSTYPDQSIELYMLYMSRKVELEWNGGSIVIL